MRDEKHGAEGRGHGAEGMVQRAWCRGHGAEGMVQRAEGMETGDRRMETGGR
jgi:hypothetical protein